LTTEVETLAGAEKCSPLKKEVGLRGIHLVDLVTLVRLYWKTRKMLNFMTLPFLSTPTARNINKDATPRCTFPAKKISQIQTQKAVGLVMVTAVAGIMKTPL
jgi:hypothetical protein